MSKILSCVWACLALVGCANGASSEATDLQKTDPSTANLEISTEPLLDYCKVMRSSTPDMVDAWKKLTQKLIDDGFLKTLAGKLRSKPSHVDVEGLHSMPEAVSFAEALAKSWYPTSATILDNSSYTLLTLHEDGHYMISFTYNLKAQKDHVVFNDIVQISSWLGTNPNAFVVSEELPCHAELENARR